jgi:hypothetical protein
VRQQRRLNYNDCKLGDCRVVSPELLKTSRLSLLEFGVNEGIKHRPCLYGLYKFYVSVYEIGLNRNPVFIGIWIATFISQVANRKAIAAIVSISLDI